MELLVVTVLGACIGALLRYLIPGRLSYGILLLPAFGAAATAITWVGLEMLGFTADGGWIWVAGLLAPVVTCSVVPGLLRKSREKRDQQRLRDLLSTEARRQYEASRTGVQA
ncbi:hypothetical protein [Humidisolicoccus flavus]|uniref:hypothetical protein n=1 Tax=Humidisolicoccus flavus TaxID=3111414 RepID=UPI00324C0C7D